MEILIVYLYVDDLIFTRSNPSLFKEFKKMMIKEFDMTDIGIEGIFISKERYEKRKSSIRMIISL